MEEYNKGDPRSQVARVHKDFYLFLGVFFSLCEIYISLLELP